jgi:hypothetical protein
MSIAMLAPGKGTSGRAMGPLNRDEPVNGEETQGLDSSRDAGESQSHGWQLMASSWEPT